MNPHETNNQPTHKSFRFDVSLLTGKLTGTSLEDKLFLSRNPTYRLFLVLCEEKTLDPRFRKDDRGKGEL